MSESRNLYDALASAIYVSRLAIRGESVDSDDKKLRASGLYDDWTAGSHKVGEIYNTHAKDGLGDEWEQTWECAQDYDNAVYPDILPGSEVWHTFHRPLHGTSPATARPFVKPTHGTVDLYKVGECMVWTDGTVKRCKRDTNFSPDEYAADWEDAEPTAEN